jgi:hypothetical protein
VSVVCCQVEVSATGWSLVQRSPTECGVSVCDRKASTMRRPRPTRGCPVMKKKIHIKFTQRALSYLLLLGPILVYILMAAAV